MNNFQNRQSQNGRPITFGQLHNGDCFIAVGLKDDEESCLFRKMYSRSVNNAARVQEGTWASFSGEWPVILVDAVTENRTRTPFERAILSELKKEAM